jgi:hypothetical protein
MHFRALARFRALMEAHPNRDVLPAKAWCAGAQDVRPLHPARSGRPSIFIVTLAAK